MTQPLERSGHMDKYEVKEQVGKGSFGCAFLVIHKETNVSYVMKRVRLARQTDAQRKASFREMELVQSLQHPYIVTCHDAWVERGHTICVVYGYCSSGDLASFLHKQSKTKQLVSEDKLKKWFAQMMIGLEYLHSRNILHRDLKSSNIFITKAGDLKIGDFGLAKVLAEGEVATSVVGTPNYMCPELFCEKPYGFKSDIWSLGCILYELTALRPAFSAFNMQGLIQKIKKVQFGPLSNSFSSEWTGTIKSMLKKSPEDRPMVGELMQHHFMGTSLKAAVERASALQLEEPESLKETFEEVHTENLSSKMNVQVNMDGDALKAAKPSRKEGLSSNLPPRRHSSQPDVNHRPRTQQGAARPGTALTNPAARPQTQGGGGWSAPPAPTSIPRNRSSSLSLKSTDPNQRAYPSQIHPASPPKPLPLSDVSAPHRTSFHTPDRSSDSSDDQHELPPHPGTAFGSFENDARQTNPHPPQHRQSSHQDLEDDDDDLAISSLVRDSGLPREQLLQTLALCSRLHQRGRIGELGQVLNNFMDTNAPAPLHKWCPFQIGDKVVVGKNRRLEGVIRYFGQVVFATGDWVGIELGMPEGKNNGTVHGINYFNCAPSCGLFVRASILQPESMTAKDRMASSPKLNMV